MIVNLEVKDMAHFFSDDFNWMLRDQTGLFPWLNDSWYRLQRHLRLGSSFCGRCGPCGDGRASLYKQIKDATEVDVCDTPLFDIVFKALMRSEIRLNRRFIPQRSHEERLTGSFVSEIDNALSLSKEQFRRVSMEIYSTEKEMDFFYYDLSRGGKIEKETGADLGFIFVVDLPDFPFTVKSVIVQAKKIDAASAQIDRAQYEKLVANSKDGSAYLFYDMDMQRLCSPLLLDTRKMANLHSTCEKEGKQSFACSFDHARGNGHPFSVFVISHLLCDKNAGQRHANFRDAFQTFRQLSGVDFNGRVAIVSLGRSIKFDLSRDNLLGVTV